MGTENFLTFPHINLIPILAGNLLDFLRGGVHKGSCDRDIDISSILRVVFQRKVVYSTNTKFFLNFGNVRMCTADLQGQLTIPS